MSQKRASKADRADRRAYRHIIHDFRLQAFADRTAIDASEIDVPIVAAVRRTIAAHCTRQVVAVSLAVR